MHAQYRCRVLNRNQVNCRRWHEYTKCIAKEHQRDMRHRPLEMNLSGSAARRGERASELDLGFLGGRVGWVCRWVEDPLPTYSRWSLPASR